MRELETLASVCPELNMANYTEDDVRHLNDWAIEMSLLVEKVAAIQQAEAKTGEPVQADSSEYLRVIASLGAALRRLSFAAQTTGGTAGPDAELQSAIGQAEQALSLGGIGQAMFATTEPVAWMASYVDPVGNDRVYVTSHHDLAVENDMHGEPKPLYTHPAPGVPDDVVRDAERYQWLMSWLQQMNLLKAEFGQMGKGEKPSDWWMLNAPYGIDKTRPFFGHGKTADAAIDSAMLAASPALRGHHQDMS